MNLFDLASRNLPDEGERSAERAPLAFDTLPTEATRPGARPAFDSAFDAAAKEFGVNADLLRGVAFAESRFRADVIDGRVRSSTGASGLMQFMPATAKEHGINPLDPIESIFGAADYLRKSLDKFGGDEQKAIASYNAGRNRRAFESDSWRDQMPKETQGYLDTVFGFADGQKAKRGTGTRQELPDGVAPSQAGAGRGAVNPPLAADLPPPAPPGMNLASMAAPEDSGYDAMGNFTGSVPSSLPTKKSSVLEGLDMPVLPFDAAEAQRLSNRAYAEATRQPGTPLKPQVALQPRTPTQRTSPATTQGEAAADFALPVRAGLKALSGIADGAGGVVRAAGDFTGIDALSRAGASASAGANQFDAGMGKAGPVSGFGPKSALPYLSDMAEGAASSLGSSAMLAAAFGAGAVIPLMSIQSAGQEYNKAREMGLEPSMALAGAVPKGVFEAVGEKFQGLDKVASAMGTLLSKGVTAQSKKTAADVLVKAGIREVPGELITYLGQTGVDLLPGIGLNQNLTMSQFIDGLRDTVVQSAMMGSALGVGGKAVGGQPSATPLPSAEQMARSRGFLTPTAPRVQDQSTTPTLPVGPTTPEQVVAPPVEASIPNAGLPSVAEQAVNNIADILGKNKRPVPTTATEDTNVSNTVANDGLDSRGAPSGRAVDAGSINAGGLLADGAAGPDGAVAPTPATLGRSPEPVGDAGVAPAPVAVLNPSGTLTVTGDPDAIRQTLKDGGVTSILSTPGGVTVGVSQAQQAQALMQDFQPVQEANVQNPAQTPAQPEAIAQTPPAQAPEAQAVAEAGQAGAGGVQADGVRPTNRNGSWVIRNKVTGEVIMETFDQKKVEALNPKKYEAVPIIEYMASLSAKPVSQAAPKSDNLPTVQADNASAQQIQAQATPENVADSQLLGQNNVPMADGGKPFKTNKAAQDARQLNKAMRVTRVAGGFALKPASDAQLAAADRTAKRMARPNTSPAGEAIAAHAFIAAGGGLSADTRADMNVGQNPRIGNRYLFAGQGRGMSMERATEMLIEDGYLPDDASQDDARSLIKRSLTNPQYTPEGVERMAEKDRDARQAAYDAEQEAISVQQDLEDAELDLTIESFEKAMLDLPQGLMQSDMTMDEALIMAGYSPDEVLDGTNDQGNENAVDAGNQGPAQAATGNSAPGDRGRKSTPGQDSRSGSQDEGLTAPTQADILAQQDRAEKASKAEAAKRRADDKAEADRQARADIAKASESAADSFVLGGDAMTNLTGQQDVFGNAPETPAPVASPAPARIPSQAELKARADIAAELANLGDILGSDFRMNITPEQEQKLLPVLTRLLDAAFRLGYSKFKDAAKFALDQIRAALGSKAADAVSLDQLQGAYIAMAGGKTGVDTKRAVIDVEDKADIESHTAKSDNDATGNSNEPSTDGRVERDRPVATPEPAVGASVQDDPGTTGGRTGQAGGSTGRGTGRGQPNGAGVPFGSAPVAGEPGDQRVPAGNATAELESIVAGDQFGERGGDAGVDGVQPDPLTTSQVDAVADRGATGLKAELAQLKANRLTPEPGDIDNIRAALPQLLPGQQDDVLKAEQRFAQPDGYGMLFTNGTGTGKTFSGLGIIKRLERQGKTNTLIVVPDDKIANDWVQSGQRLQLSITRLTNTEDAGQGIVITTYANLGENDALATRQWDAVVADEAHSLMQSADGAVTGYLENLRAITYHPQGAFTRYSMLNRDGLDRVKQMGEDIMGMERDMAASDTTDARRNALDSQSENLQAELAALLRQLEAAQTAMKAEVKAKQGAARPRAVFLSATPFAYEKTIDWANGYLFEYKDGYPFNENRTVYNQPDPREYYFQTRFGYSMRYNKLTQPDGKVDSGMMQRMWNGELKKSGSLSGRMLDVVPDYDRRFVTVNSAIGNRIDEALEWLTVQRSTAAKDDRGMSTLSDAINNEFKFLQKRYLLEAIKATEVIPIIKQHMALGRKVVVFHDYKKGGGFNPFEVNAGSLVNKAGGPSQETIEQFNAALAQFNAQFGDLVNYPFADMDSPIEVFKRELPQTLLVNGDEKAKDLLARYTSFQDDANGPQVMLVQSAKNKGWSGHDTTGKHQRVLINLGQPTAPTLAIQQEGRIYRTGQASDAIMRYLNTGTNWERWTFASTIASRASTAENLGMGEMARALKDSFIQAFEESDTFAPGHQDEGKGGKERDAAANNALSEYDRAKSLYFGQQKKNSRTKAQEGADYFATPEPVGLKMVSFLDPRSGEDLLEPSGGHGAIARWFPEKTNKTVIEPSLALRSRLALAMNAQEDRILDGTFEDHAVVNKYDGIAMNPPFGVGGKTAVEHLAKAATHLRAGGRIVALIPVGPMADKRFAQWFDGSSERAAKPLYTDPNHGPVYKGDTLTLTGFGTLRTIVVDKIDSGRYVRDANTPPSGGVNITAISKVKPTGARTEQFKAADGLQLVASIKLPQVTFERAGTAVATRIVVIEKATKDQIDTRGVYDLDLSNIETTAELFDRLENMALPSRAKPVEAEAEPAKPAQSARAEKAKAQSAEMGSTVMLDGKPYPVAVYTTNAGKEITGTWVPSRDIAAKFDARPFQKRPLGWFVRERDFPAQAPAGEDAPSFSRAEPQPFASRLEANVAGLKQNAVAVSDDNGSWLLGPKIAAYTPQEFKDAQQRVDRLNIGLARVGMPPAQVLRNAPTGPMVAGSRIAGILGFDVTFIENVAGFEGVSLGGQAFVSASEQHPEIGLIGHEVLHSFKRLNPAGYEALAEQIRPYLKSGVVEAKRQAEGKLSGREETTALAEDELLADLNGAMWLDPKFWRQMASNDPSLFRQVAYRFMELATKAFNGLTRFKADTMVTDVDAVRKIIAREFAYQAQEQGSSAADFAEQPAFKRRQNQTNTPNTLANGFAPSGRRTVSKVAADWVPGLGLDGTGRVQLAFAAKLKDFLAEKSAPFWERLGLKGQSPELRRQIRQMKLVVQDAQDTAVSVAREAQKLSADERDMVSDIIEQELATGVLPPTHALQLAQTISTTMEAQSDELVRLGMLSKDAADKWRGKYLPRYYQSKMKDLVPDAWSTALRGLSGRTSAMKGIKGNHLKRRGLSLSVPESQLANYTALGWAVDDASYTPSLNGDMQVPVWRDFTKDEREKMGEIRDVSFRFVMGYMESQKDIALGTMFEGMASDAAISMKREQAGFEVMVPDTTVQGTGVKRYGMLAGRFVSRNTMSHLSQIEEAQSDVFRLYKEGMGIWKEGKTVLNPVAHTNNIVSNLTMAHLAGVSYHRVDKYISAIADFAKASPKLKEARDAGLFLATVSDEELKNMLPQELRDMAIQQESYGRKVGRNAFNLMAFGLRKPLGTAYQAEDLFFRYLIWKDATERGMDQADAVDYAQKYIFTYDDLPKAARKVRDFAIPFFSYSYKAIPALLSTAVTHPWRMAAPAAALWAYQAAMYAMLAGSDDEDWLDALNLTLNNKERRDKAIAQQAEEQKLLPEWQKGTTALGTPKVLRMGKDELTGLPLFIDVSRMVPGGDVFDVSPNSGGVPVPQWMVPSHPLFTTAIAMFANKDLYFGKEITDSNDTTGEAAQKRLTWLYKQAAPAIAINNYHWERMMGMAAGLNGGDLPYVPDALGGDATGVGRDGNPIQPKYAVPQTFGIKIRPMDLDTSEKIQGNDKQRKIRDIDTEMQKLKRLNQKGAINDRAYDQADELAKLKIGRLRDGQTVDGKEKD